MESTDCVVKLKDVDMYIFYTVTVNFDGSTANGWNKNGYKLADDVVTLLSECKHGYTVLDSHEIDFESVEDAVRFKLMYQS